MKMNILHFLNEMDEEDECHVLWPLINPFFLLF